MQNKFNITGLFIGAVLCLSASACQSEPVVEPKPTRPIKAMQIGSTAQIAGKLFPGVAKATQEVELSFRVSGVLQKMPIKIGQEVRVGDVLAVLDQRDFQVAVDDAKANLANASAKMKNAKAEYDRVLKIRRTDPDIVSDSLVDERLTTYETAKATHASALAGLNVAEDKLSYATLKAPFDGVIVQRYVENFQDVAANNPVFRLVDLSKIEMDISIPENLISNLPYVQNPRVFFEAFPDISIPVRIKEVSNEASQSTRTYNIRLIMEPPGGVDILPGMSGYATSEIVVPGNESLIVVPLSAVFSGSDSNTSYVWKYNEQAQRVSKVAVQKGKITDQGLIITDGLKSGDWIATAGVHFLSEGQKVRLLDEHGVKP